ncbi:MAG: hypothetical protein D6812_01060 [Deltaproteobacteria bacterium]|nr:MAG: hypothetical protein D6812_01060 [Deltaproteobacteria bacterium]
MTINYDTMSVEFWMKGPATQSDTHYLVIDKQHGWVTPYAGWLMQGQSWDGRLAWAICYYDGVNRCAGILSSQSLLDDTWHHVVGTYDGSDLVLYHRRRNGGNPRSLQQREFMEERPERRPWAFLAWNGIAEPLFPQSAR